MDNKDLVRLCQSGDREALGILYETYLPPMQKVVAYYIHDKNIAWDILHDGFIIAFSSIGTLKQASRLEPWLTSIMRNLSLQYLKKTSVCREVPLTEVTDIADDERENAELTREQLERIIEQLPEGYGKVFRLAVLDGLSHKEIAAMLGIAPHSSSSQLVRAKSMLRRMIRQYRIEAGLLSLAVFILIVRHFLPGHEDMQPSVPTLSSNNVPVHTDLPDTAAVISEGSDSISTRPGTIYKLLHKQKAEEQAIIHEAVAQEESQSSAPADSLSEENTNPIIKPDYRISDKDFPTARQETPAKQHDPHPNWSLALAYSGASNQSSTNRYSIPDPSDPDLPTDVPSDEVEVTETARHKMPVIIGLSLSKPLTSRWSIETGVRYSFMESAFRYESKLSVQRVNQQIHYLGIPLKFNCRLYSAGGFSLYGQGGGALDIPVSGQQSVRTQFSIEKPSPETGNRHIHAPLQWSVEGGLGIQYHFTPKVSIFAEPSVHYYFNPGGEIKTIRQERPFEFTLPVGLRLTW